MTKGVVDVKNIYKRWKNGVFFLVAMGILAGLSGCGGSGTTSNDSNIGSNTSEGSTEVSSSESMLPSTPENDTDIGLKNIKIDDTSIDLTEEQKMVLEYFDDDYLTVPSYEFLRRYPDVFDGAQLRIWGTVSKVLSINSGNIEMILWLDVGPVEYEYSWDYPEYEGNYILVNGKVGNISYMEGDTLLVYGRYGGIETVDVDGVSYTVPKVDMQSAYFDTSPAPNDIFRYIPKFDLPFVKQVAETIFGDVEIREPIIGTDITEEQYWLWEEVCGQMPCYAVELENQSNAKFTKFFFYTDISSDVYGGDRIQDAKDSMGVSNIYRAIEFAADFEHFFLFTYDHSLEMLTLEYYDSSLNKIWEREFMETTSANYDYTNQNIYLTANNELYIINLKTGEDTYAPAYVGEKLEVRKLSDGILLISSGKSDGVMKIGLDGTLIWKTNLQNDTYSVDGVQVINNRIVISQYYWESSEDYGTHYIVLDNATGEIIQDAVSIS